MRTTRRAFAVTMLLSLLAGQASIAACETPVSDGHDSRIGEVVTSGAEMSGHAGHPMASRDAEREGPAGDHHTGDAGDECQVLMNCGAMAMLDQAVRLPHEARIVLLDVTTTLDSALSAAGELELPPPRTI